MKQKGILWLSVALSLLLCGCEALPYPRELEETMLVRVLGVDSGAEGVTLTAADLPGEGETDGALRLATGENLAQSRQRLKETGEESMTLTHVTQVIVGAEGELSELLEALLFDREVGQTATVWLAETEARPLMEQVGGGAKRLSSIELNTEGLKTRTILEALAALTEDGEVALPLLAEEEGTLIVAGERIWKEGQHEG